MVLMIPPMAVTLVAAAIFVIVLFGMTDWWEIIVLAMIITLALYVITAYPVRK